VRRVARMEERERERVGREEWAKRVERWADSGLTASEFAAELGINPRTLSYWNVVRARARGRTQGSSSLELRCRVAETDRKVSSQKRNGLPLGRPFSL
jgi:hypothetical protein